MQVRTHTLSCIAHTLYLVGALGKSCLFLVGRFLGLPENLVCSRLPFVTLRPCGSTAN